MALEWLACESSRRQGSFDEGPNGDYKFRNRQLDCLVMLGARSDRTRDIGRRLGAALYFGSTGSVHNAAYRHGHRYPRKGSHNASMLFTRRMEAHLIIWCGGGERRVTPKE